jgi:hypothetical protein
VRDRVHHFDWLVAGVGRADVSSYRHAAWKLAGLLLVGIREPCSHEVLDEPSHLHAEAPQLAVHAVPDRNGLFELAACRSLLNRIMQAAEDEGLLPANPVGKVPPPKRPVDPEVIFGRTQPRVVTPKQLGQLLAHAEPEVRDRLLVLAGTGLRAGELCGLRRERVQLRERRLEVVTVRSDAAGSAAATSTGPRAPPASGWCRWPQPSMTWSAAAFTANGARCCSPKRPSTSSGTATCARSGRPRGVVTWSAWTCAARMTCGIPSRPGWRMTASRPG